MNAVKTQNSKVLLVGLPESGKSTYTAALWAVVNSDQVPGALRLDSYTGDDTYLNSLYAEWSRGKELTRTHMGNEGLGEMELLRDSRKSHVSGNVMIPDLAGERYEMQWEKRQISKDHEKHLREVEGILVFIHPHKIQEGQLNNRTVRAADKLFSGNAGIPTVPVTASTVEQEFSLKHVPTQAVLVDILQTSRRVGTGIRKIAVVVSAWDLVSEEGKTPAQWLQAKFPLLDQFLKTSRFDFEFTAWGISAQGGKIGINRDVTELLVKGENRIIVTDGKVSNSDITRPLKWLFFQG